MGEPAVMPFIKRAKILSTRVYEFFEGGNIDTIATSPDKLVRRTNPATFSYLRKSGIHKTFGEFVIHTLQALAQRCPTKMKRGLTFSPFYLRPITARHVRFTPKADMCSALAYVRFVPTADMIARLNLSSVSKSALRLPKSGMRCSTR